jgi:hypothetical protein
MAKNTIIYNSHFELMEVLSDEQAGKLIKAIGKFNSGNEVSINDPLVNGIFLAIKRDFILQTENYEKKVKANRENGSKGGRPTNNSIRKTINGIEIPKEIDEHFIYLIYDSYNDEYKIGETKDLIQRRYDIKRPSKNLEVVHFEIADTISCQRLETEILNEYKKYSLGGDWFKFEEEQVNDILHKLSEKTQWVSNYPNLSHTIPQNLKDKDKDKDKDIEKYKENSNSISLEASQLRVGTSILNSQQLRKLKEFEEKFGNLDSVDYLINE